MAGSTIKGITIEIGGDTTKLDKALSGVNKQSRDIQKELKEVEKALKLDPKNTELLAQKQTLLKEAVSATSEKLDVLKKAEEQVQQQFERGEVSEEQYRALQREVIKTEAELKNLKEAAESGNSALEKVGEAAGKIGEKSTTLGKKLLPVTAAITGIGTASIAAFNELDAGYDTIITKTGASGEALERLQDSMDNVFSSLPIEAEAAGIAIGEVNTRFGATGKTLEDLSAKFIQFAEINGTDLNGAIDSVDAIMTKFGVDTSQTGNVLGLLTKAGQDTGISMDTLQNSLQTNGATLKEMGLDLTSSVNLLAQFEANGVDASAALAGLKKAQQNATAEGKTLEEALGTTIESIKNAGSETEALQIATELFGKKGAAEMTQAIREGRLSVDDLSGSLEDYGTIVEDTFNATLDPPDKAKVALNNLKVAGADLGNTLMSSVASVLERVVEKVKTFTTWFKNLNDTQKETIIKIAAVVAAIGPALIIFGKISSAISTIIGVVSKIGPAISAAKSAFAAFHAVLAANPIIAVVTAIVALIAIIVTLYNKCDWFREAVNQVFGAIKEAFFTAFNAINVFFTETLPDAIDSAIEFFRGLWNSIVAVFTGVGSWFKAKFTEAYKAVTLVFSGIGQWFSARYKEVTGAFSDVVSWFRGKFTEAYTGIQNVFNGIGSFFSGIWNTISGIFTNIGTNIGDAIGGAFKSAMNGALAAAESKVNGAIGFINGAIDIINKLPGVSVGHIGELSLPRLAHGGILKNGQAIMAEAGPELIQMVNGEAIVTPLTRSARNTALDAAAEQKGRSFVQNVNITSPKALSPYETARQTRNATRNMVLQLQGGA